MAATIAGRVAGALLGHACGDALGSTTEFLNAAEVRRRWPNGHRDLTGGGLLGWRPGQGTDDTDLTWAVVSAYLDGYSLQGAADRMLAWYETSPPDIGNTTAAGLAAYQSGRNPRTSGVEAVRGSMAAGNGSLMRALPTALVRPHSAQRAVEAHELSAVTHADARCVDACVAYCDLANHLIMGVDPDDAIGEVLDDSPIGSETRAAIIDGARTGLAAEELDTSGFVLATLKVAVWALLQPGALEEVLVEIANLGGDADTTGAVAGGLLGARHGGAAIPERWTSRLEYRPRLLAAVPSLVELRGRAAEPDRGLKGRTS